MRTPGAAAPLLLLQRRFIRVGTPSAARPSVYGEPMLSGPSWQGNLSAICSWRGSRSSEGHKKSTE